MCIVWEILRIDLISPRIDLFFPRIDLFFLRIDRIFLPSIACLRMARAGRADAIVVVLSKEWVRTVVAWMCAQSVVLASLWLGWKC